MRTYYLQLTNYDSSAPVDVVAINNPADSGNIVSIRCVSNVHAESITVANYTLRTFASLATGGVALALEPGDESPRVARRDPSDAEPGFVALYGAFTPPATPVYDETFTVISREGSANGCRELADGPIVLRPGSCAVLSLLGSDFSAASVAIDVLEQDIIPDIDVSVVEFTRLLGELFDGSGALSALNWTNTPTGSGTALQSSGALVVATGVTANSAMLTESVRRARFMTDVTHEFEAWIRIPDAGTANNVRRWGPLLATNGFYFELSGTTFAVGTRKASVSTSVTSASWDLQGFALDTNYHHYLVRYNGNAVEFWIDDIQVHRIHPGSSPLTEVLDLPIRFENTNSGGLASNCEIHVRGAAIKRRGPQHGAMRSHRHDGTAGTTTLKSGSGTLGNVSITQAGSGGSLITIYDNTTGSGEIITRINADALQTLSFKLEFSLGLTIVTTVNSGDVVIEYD